MVIGISKDIFPGFYGTFLGDHMEEMLTEGEYEDFKDSVCEKIVDLAEKVTPVNTWTLSSPREYNFRNDTLEITIDLEIEDFLFLAIQDDEGVITDYLECAAFENLDKQNTIDTYVDTIFEALMWIELDSNPGLSLEEYLLY